MDITVKSGNRCGSISAPPSKSCAHRLLICAALGSKTVNVDCGVQSLDIRATADCLSALCADIKTNENGIVSVTPKAVDIAGEKQLFCGESGSTLRFLLPVCGALGVNAVFNAKGRLAERPLSPLDEVLRSHGMTVEVKNGKIYCGGKLSPGNYEIAGDVSSQFISGLLFALPLLNGDSTLTVTGRTESSAYVDMTEDALRTSGICFNKENNVYCIKGNAHYSLPAITSAEGDWSNAAFFLCAGAIGKGAVTVTGLSENSRQGDSAVLDVLQKFGADVKMQNGSVTVCGGELEGTVIDAREIPDLIPVLSVTAAAAKGKTEIINAARLRLKESDRLSATAAMLKTLGCDVCELPDGLVINGGKPLCGGTVDSFNDHRIAMSAAVAATFSVGDVTVTGAECTAKSYPHFFDDFNSLEVL